MVKVVKEEPEFVEVEVGAGVHIGDIQWDIAKIALLKNKKVVYTFNKDEFVVTPEEAKETITPERVRDAILDLETEEELLIKKLLKSKKERRELRRFLKFLEDKVFKDSPK